MLKLRQLILIKKKINEKANLGDSSRPEFTFLQAKYLNGRPCLDVGVVFGVPLAYPRNINPGLWI